MPYYIDPMTDFGFKKISELTGLSEDETRELDK